MKWWMITINGKRFCIEARQPSDAVFAAMRTAECGRQRYYIDSGTIEFCETIRVKGMSKKAFKEMVEGAEEITV